MTAESKGGVSMLDKLAGNIVETKSAAGSKLSPALTPVAGERVGLPNTPAAFPNDVPNDVIRMSVQRIEAEIVSLQGVITALKLLMGVPEVVEAEIAKDAATSKVLLEREADRRVADQKKAEAGDKRAAERVHAAEANPLAAVVEAVEAKDRKRAAVLAAMMEAPSEEVAQIAAEVEEFSDRMARLSQEAQASAFTAPAAGNGWSCPKHGDTNIATKVSPRRSVQFRKCAVVDCHEFEKV